MLEAPPINWSHSCDEFAFGAIRADVADIRAQAERGIMELKLHDSSFTAQ
jgi:hypothetical protein